jgi:hypothetical protein
LILISVTLLVAATLNRIDSQARKKATRLAAEAIVAGEPAKVEVYSGPLPPSEPEVLLLLRPPQSTLRQPP